MLWPVECDGKVYEKIVLNKATSVTNVTANAVGLLRGRISLGEIFALRQIIERECGR